MNISLNWLKDYLKTDLNVDEICSILTSIGLEVDGYEKTESIKGGLKGLVIGQVKTCIPHPNSDHLHITTVDLGDGKLTPIVCGAPNVAAGQKVIVATLGTVLYSGDEEFTIKKSKIRGEESEGMICAEDEIGVGKSHDGIIVLPEDVTVGTPAAQYYNVTSDYTIEVDITPNRADGTSHLGVARDLAAYLSQKEDIKYTLPSVDNFKPDSTTSDIKIELERPEACRRYAGVCIEGVKIQESPEWLQTKLKAIGLHPINNVVDITNFILFELGQPLHSFDLDKIKGHRVIIKSYPQDTKFTTLDGVERKLDANDLMICNTEEPMCIAGVFGGLESGISDNTKNVFLESACFDPVFVRKTARRHGLNTDASFRFERGTDPNIVIYALKRAALLIKELCGGKITSDIIDIYPQPVKDFEVKVKFDHIDKLIGKALGHDTIKHILNSLEIKIVEEDSDGMTLNVPPYRVDVKREADIVEDILRIYGFNNIELPEKVNSTLSYVEKPDDYKTRDLLSNFLSANGFNEIMNNSLTKASYYESLQSFPFENCVKILNPLSSDLSVMRQTLLFGGLESIAYNRNRKNTDIRMYEFGKSYTFHKSDAADHHTQYHEENHLGLFISGNKSVDSWNGKAEKTDFFNLKGYCDLLLKKLGFDVESLTISECKQDIFSDAITYSQKSKEILSFGIVNPKHNKTCNIDTDVYYADICWENILQFLKNHTTSYRPTPKYPMVVRDLALLIDKNVTFDQIKNIAYKTEKDLLKNVSLFDVFENEKLGSGKKSYAVSFTLLDEQKTLTDKQIEKIMNKLIGAYKFQLGAEIR